MGVQQLETVEEGGIRNPGVIDPNIFPIDQVSPLYVTLGAVAAGTTDHEGHGPGLYPGNGVETVGGHDVHVTSPEHPSLLPTVGVTDLLGVTTPDDGGTEGNSGVILPGVIVEFGAGIVSPPIVDLDGAPIGVIKNHQLGLVRTEHGRIIGIYNRARDVYGTPGEKLHVGGSPTGGGVENPIGRILGNRRKGGHGGVDETKKVHDYLSGVGGVYR